MKNILLVWGCVVASEKGKLGTFKFFPCRLHYCVASHKANSYKPRSIRQHMQRTKDFLLRFVFPVTACGASCLGLRRLCLATFMIFLYFKYANRSFAFGVERRNRLKLFLLIFAWICTRLNSHLHSFINRCSLFEFAWLKFIFPFVYFSSQIILSGSVASCCALMFYWEAAGERLRESFSESNSSIRLLFHVARRC